MKATVLHFLLRPGGVALVCGLFASSTALAALDYEVIDRGPHHRTWQTVRMETDAAGAACWRTNQYVELRTGLHFFDGQQWRESQPQFAVRADGGAAAEWTQHRARIGFQAGQPVARLDLPGGERWQARVLGLALYDPATGQSALIAEWRPTSGELAGDAQNQVVFADCFDGVAADLVYEIGAAHFAQDIVLREAIDVTAYGFDPATARLEVWTEVQDATPPRRQLERWTERRAGHRPGEEETIDCADETLDFGGMIIGPGRCFALPGDRDDHAAETRQSRSDNGEARVQKSWHRIDGKDFLIESVPVRTLAPLLETLPPAQGGASKAAPRQTRNRMLVAVASQGAGLAQMDPRATSTLRLPPFPPEPGKAELLLWHAKRGRAELPLRQDYYPVGPLGGAAAPPYQTQGDGSPLFYQNAPANARRASIRARGDTPLALAARPSPLRHGVVLDYVVNLTASQTVLRGDMTYYVSGTVNLSQPTIEAGAVVKYARGAKIVLTGVNCQTAPYRPAVFTAVDDNTVGVAVAGSTGTPMGVYANPAIDYYAASGNCVLHNMRVRYAERAVAIGNNGTGHALSHFQIVNCGTALTGNGVEVALRNVLVYNCGAVVQATNATVRAEHLTVNQFNVLNAGTTTYFYLVNSLVAGVGTQGGFVSLSFSGWEPTADGVFQSGVAGQCYLAETSLHRNQGTARLGGGLLAEIRERTTYPPQAWTTPIATATLLERRSIRDTDTPDRGYHYDSIDYYLNNVAVSAPVQLAAGIVLASDRTLFNLQAGAQVSGEGTPTALIRLVRIASVQEQAWAAGAVWAPLCLLDSTITPWAEIRLRFADLPMLADQGHFIYRATGLGKLALTDCRLSGSGVSLDSVAGSRTVALTNNLIDESCVTVYGNLNGDNTVLYARNNLLRQLSLDLNASAGNVWAWHDNLFDTVTLTERGAAITHSYNAYYPATATKLKGATSGNQTLSSLAYQSGSLGPCYLGSNASLVDQGSRLASAAGLYHYTTRTDQLREADSPVDIGPHYVAMKNILQPFDADADGAPDYMEDTNGNGTADVGEPDASRYTVSEHPHDAALAAAERRKVVQESPGGDNLWLATFTPGARTVILAGPARTGLQEVHDGRTYSVYLDNANNPGGLRLRNSQKPGIWVRTLPAPYAGPIPTFWLDSALSANNTGKDDLLAIAWQYIAGAPAWPAPGGWGIQDRGDASYAAVGDGESRPAGADFNDYLNTTVVYPPGNCDTSHAPDGRTHAPDPNFALSVDCSGFMRLVYGYRHSLEGNGYVDQLPLCYQALAGQLPRRACWQFNDGPGKKIITWTGDDGDITPTDFSRMQIGDLVFFEYPDGVAGEPDNDYEIDHVGIYLGKGNRTGGEVHEYFISSRAKMNGPTIGSRSDGWGGQSILDDPYPDSTHNFYWVNSYRCVRRL